MKNLKETGFRKLANPDANANNTLTVFKEDTFPSYEAPEKVAGHVIPLTFDFHSGSAATFNRLYVEDENGVVKNEEAASALTLDGTVDDVQDFIVEAMRKMGYGQKDGVSFYVKPDKGATNGKLVVVGTPTQVGVTTGASGTPFSAAEKLEHIVGVRKYSFKVLGNETALAIAVNKRNGEPQETYSIDIAQATETEVDVATELLTNLDTVYEAEVTKNADNDYEINLWVYTPFRLTADGDVVEPSEVKSVFVNESDVPTE